MNFERTFLADNTEILPRGVVYGGGYYVTTFILNSQGVYTINILYSTDCLNWTAKVIKNSGAFNVTIGDIVFCGGCFVLPYITTMGPNKVNVLYTTTPADNWEERTAVYTGADSVTVVSVQNSNDKVVICGSNKTDNITNAIALIGSFPDCTFEAKTIYQGSELGNGATIASIWDNSKYWFYTLIRTADNKNIHQIYRTADFEDYEEVKITHDTLDVYPKPAFAYEREHNAAALFLHGNIWVSSGRRPFVQIPYPESIQAESVYAATSSGTRILASAGGDNSPILQVLYNSGNPTEKCNWYVQTIDENSQTSRAVIYANKKFLVIAGNGVNIKPSMYVALHDINDFKTIKDRVPIKPNQVKLTLVARDTYKLERADDPTEIGTRIGKATLISDDAVLSVWHDIAPTVQCTPSAAFTHIGKNIHQIGDIVTTARDLSNNEEWLECKGGEITHEAYPQLYDMLQDGSIEGDWNKKEITTDGSRIVDMACVTDGAWFIVLTQKYTKTNWSDIYVYYTQDPSGEWQSTKITSESTSPYKYFSQMHYYFNEFFFFSYSTDSQGINSYTVTCYHTTNPTNGWKSHTIADFSGMGYISENLISCVNNGYYACILTTFLDSSQSKKHLFIIYNDNLTETAKRTQFGTFSSNDNWSNVYAISYLNNKWVVSIETTKLSSSNECVYTSDLFYSNTLENLKNSSANKTTLYNGTQAAKFSNIVYGNGYYVAITSRSQSQDAEIAIYRTQNLTNTFRLVTTLPSTQYINIKNHTLIFAEGKFMFLSNSDSMMLYTSADAQEWVSQNIAGAKTSPFQLSYSADTKILFSAVYTDQYKLMALWKKIGKSLPKITPPIGLKTYIKAKEGE